MNPVEPSHAPALFLDWDSAFFKKRIGRVQTRHLTHTNAEQIDHWAKQEQMDCIYYLADGLDLTASAAAENNGYHLMDLRITYKIDLREDLAVPELGRIRTARKEDLPVLRLMARENHQISRFFADVHFSREKCMELYEKWIERDFREKDHFLWVWEEEERPVAYTSANLSPQHTAEIGLVGVHPVFRGRGIGLDFQIWVLNQLQSLGIQHVEVVTQGRNIKAQNMYLKCGYRLKSNDLWYHKWYET